MTIYGEHVGNIWGMAVAERAVVIASVFYWSRKSEFQKISTPKITTPILGFLGRNFRGQNFLGESWVEILKDERGKVAISGLHVHLCMKYAASAAHARQKSLHTHSISVSLSLSLLY